MWSKTNINVYIGLQYMRRHTIPLSLSCASLGSSCSAAFSSPDGTTETFLLTVHVDGKLYLKNVYKMYK